MAGFSPCGSHLVESPFQGSEVPTKRLGSRQCHANFEKRRQGKSELGDHKMRVTLNQTFELSQTGQKKSMFLVDLQQQLCSILPLSIQVVFKDVLLGESKRAREFRDIYWETTKTNEPLCIERKIIQNSKNPTNHSPNRELLRDNGGFPR